MEVYLYIVWSHFCCFWLLLRLIPCFCIRYNSSLFVHCFLKSDLLLLRFKDVRESLRHLISSNCLEYLLDILCVLRQHASVFVYFLVFFIRFNHLHGLSIALVCFTKFIISFYFIFIFDYCFYFFNSIFQIRCPLLISFFIILF